MMLLKFNVLLLIFSCVSSDGSELLEDLPLQVSKGDYMIRAKLTERASKDVENHFDIKEHLSVDERSTIRGKIMVRSTKKSFDINYVFTNQTDAKQRLFIQDNECILIRYGTGDNPTWEPSLPETDHLLTSILLIGPSIIFRLNLLTWIIVKSEMTRGRMLKVYKAFFGQFTIKVYLKNNFDRMDGIESADRIAISSNRQFFGSWSVIFDYYQIDRNFKRKIDEFVSVTPGIGCPIYLEKNVQLPKLKDDIVHIQMRESIVEGLDTSITLTLSEVYAFEKLKLLRLKTQFVGQTTEVLYDYNLGVAYTFRDDSGECTISPVDKLSPGIDPVTRKYTLDKLLLLNENFAYLGEVNIDQRNGLKAKAWESTQYSKWFDDKVYDKLVTTQYFIEETNGDPIIISTILNGYQKLESKKLTLVLKTTRDYMNFRFGEEFHDKFSLAQCANIDTQMTLTFQLACSENNCIELAEKQVYKLKEKFKETIVYNFNLSPLRISDMQLMFGISTISITVNFLEAPNLQSIYEGRILTVGNETISRLKMLSSNNENECLIESSYAYNFDVVLYCPQLNICGTLEKLEYLKEDQSGYLAKVYSIPLHNVNRILREIALKDLQEQLLRDTAYKTIMLTDDQMTAKKYKVVDILDETRNKVDKSRDLIKLQTRNKKFDPDDVNVVVVPNVKSLGDCYRACVNSDEINCGSLAFCSGAKSFDCYVSSYTNMSNMIFDKNPDPGCVVYVTNHLLGYSKVPHRRYKTLGQESHNQLADNCAATCDTMKGCFSFQYCDRICTFGGHYTDSNTEYDVSCEIYIPKVVHKFTNNGRKIVSEKFHTEINLNLDQCASICYNWADDGDNKCRSFNFCPKGKSTSTCSLSKYSSKNKTVKKIESTNCRNYELIQSPSKQQSGSSYLPISDTNGSIVFGIVIIFLFSGFLFGFGLPFGYQRLNAIKHRRSASIIDRPFKWSRQSNED